MKTTKHTPGPWNVASYEAGKVVIEAHDGSDVADIVWCDRPGIVDQCRANAALIAAAPELLAFAIECARADSDCGESIREAARAAIAKAEGK